jgi:hypothetical protein
MTYSHHPMTLVVLRLHHATEGEGKRVGVEVAARAVTDLVIGYQVEVPVDQPSFVVVLLWEGGATGVLADKGHTSAALLGNG